MAAIGASADNTPVSRAPVALGLPARGAGSGRLVHFAALIEEKQLVDFGTAAMRRYFCFRRLFANVRYWHKADMSLCTAHVRFRG